jgi:hypothetical protein
MTKERVRRYSEALVQSMGITFYIVRSREGRFLVDPGHHRPELSSWNNVRHPGGAKPGCDRERLIPLRADLLADCRFREIRAEMFELAELLEPMAAAVEGLGLFLRETRSTWPN